MSNRIYKFAKESGLIEYESDGKMEEIEKFAGLIVQECIDILEFHGYDEAIPYIEWKAKNGFGVE